LKIQKAAAAIMKITESRYLCNSLTYLYKIWYVGAKWFSPPLRPLKNLNFKKSRWRTATILKTVKSPYLCNCLTDFDEIWHGGAHCPITMGRPLKFRVFESPRWRPGHLENHKIAISPTGPLLFLLYMSELFDIVSEFGFTSHAYADDTQLYISVPAASCPEAIERFASCLEHVRDWMASNRLKLNEDKTQIIWLGTRHQLNKTLPQTLTLRNGTVLQFSTAVKNIGVLIDSQLTMADHIVAVCRSGFFQLRQLRLIRQSLTPATVKNAGPCIHQQSTRLL